MHKKLLIFLFWGGPTTVWASQPKSWQINFQHAATPVMEKIIDLHHYLLIIIFSIAILVISILLYASYRFCARRNPKPSKRAHHTVLESIWTIIPVLILASIAIPSFHLMFYMDKAKNAEFTIKVVGYQWYWHYEYPDHHLQYDSMIVPDNELKPGQPRLLTVNNEVVVPVGAVVRLLFTGADVIHSWAVPALGVKKDCIPGRLAEAWMQIQRPGVYYGQCSELCGMKHGFMPIAVRAVSREDFQVWLKQAKQPASS